MGHYSKIQYNDYINEHMKIMRQRFKLCEQVMENRQEYDYWAYNYAYYLCSLNLEQLNYLRYIFGEPINALFELKMFMAQKYYIMCINKYGWPNKIDWKERWICIHINKTRVISAHRLIMPSCFKEMEGEFEEIEEALEKLATQNKELTIKKYFIQE